MKSIEMILSKIPYTEKDIILKCVREYFSFSNIYFDEKILFSSTSCYFLKNNQNVVLKESFPLKIFIPDFIMENFSLHTTEQKKVILSFLKVFITELIYLNSTIQLNKNIYSYTDFLNCESTKEISLKCKRDVVLLFGKFFKEKIQITENIPKKIKNYNSFSLGKNYIYSSYTDKKSFLIGSMFYSFLNRVSVKIEIHDYEIERLKFFLNVIFYKNRTLLFSSQNKVKNISYIFNFIIEKNKLISVTSIPNLKNYRNYFAIS